MRGPNPILFAGIVWTLILVGRCGKATAAEVGHSSSAADCFSSVQVWLDNSATECPLSYWGFTVYGKLDFGGGYESHAAPFNPDNQHGVQELISKQNRGSAWQIVPGGLSQSNVGVEWKKQMSPEWLFIGDINFGFDAYSLHFVDGPKSLADNNTTPQYLQSTNVDSSQTYGPINGRAYAGFESRTFGTLTYGRQTAFSAENVGAYDPFGGAYAFSPIGNNTLLGGGLGDSELTRYTNSIKYLYTGDRFRGGVLSQVGGWSAGNNAQYAIEGDFGFNYAGFSLDGAIEYARDAVVLSTFSGPVPAPFANSTLRATIENQRSLQVVARYNLNDLTIYGGYQHDEESAPSDLPAGVDVRRFNGGYFATYGSGSIDAGGQTASAFPASKLVQLLYVGGRYPILSNLEIAGGYYHFWQNNYLGATETLTSCVQNSSLGPKAAASGPYVLQGTSSGKCAGSENVISEMVDWRAAKRVDIYGGMMYSKVAGGMASGFIATGNLAATAGIRISF